MARGRLGPLAARLALAFVAVALVAVAVLGGLALVASRSEVSDLVERRHDQYSADVSATLAQAFEQAGGWADADLRGAFAVAASARADLVVLAADGELVADSSSTMADLMARMHGDDPPAASELGDARRVAVTVGDARVGTAVLRFPAADPTPEREVRDALGRTVVAGAAAAVLAALAVAVFVSRRLTCPLVS